MEKAGGYGQTSENLVKDEEEMKYLGVDYGLAKIGLAISEGEIAEPLAAIDIRNWESVISNICSRQGIEKIIIGISENKMAEKTKKFGEELAKLTGLPVEYYDETLSSQQAVQKMNEAGKPRMKKKSSEHPIAAAIILQAYLDNLS